MIRAVILARPVHMYRFIADMLDVELAQRTFDDIIQGCALKKSRKLEPYPTASCELMIDFLRQTQAEVFGEDQFLLGQIPDYELCRPALDRYRDYAGIGVFDQTVCEGPPEPTPLETIEEMTETDECVPLVEKKTPLPPLPPILGKAPAYDIGPIPQYDVTEPALDRYRDFAGIGPFDLIGQLCAEHEPLCRSGTFQQV